MRRILLLMVILIEGKVSFSQDSYVDIDSNTYQLVQIENQIWMLENLKVKHYQNGDPIAFASNSKEWQKLNQEGKGAFCYYKDDASNGDKFGLLYNKHALIDPRGLFPDSYQIPTHSDIKEIQRNRKNHNALLKKVHQAEFKDQIHAPGRLLAKSKWEKLKSDQYTTTWYNYDLKNDTLGKITWTPTYMNAKYVYCQGGCQASEGHYIRLIVSKKGHAKINEAIGMSRVNYERFIKEADDLFVKKSFNESKLAYENAARSKPDEAYPMHQIEKCNYLMAKDPLKYCNDYKTLIECADKEYDKNNIWQAKELYQKALLISPNESYPAQRIVEIKAFFVKKEEEKWKKEQSILDSIANQVKKKNFPRGVFVHQNQTYKWIEIGSDRWLAQNLNVAKFRNGEIIKEAKTVEEWIEAGKKGIPAWCYLNNDPKNGELYGRLYNWWAVNDKRGLAPTGYHVPTHEEFKALKLELGERKAGYMVKSIEGWADHENHSGNGCDVVGFNVLPGGYRNSKEAKFPEQTGVSTYLWTSEEADVNIGIGTAGILQLSNSDTRIDWADYFKSFGAYVRCVKNK